MNIRASWRHRARFFAVATVVALGAGSVLAQPYPNHPVKMIVPFAPGGATDVLARMVGAKLTESWGQQVVEYQWFRS